MFSFIKQVKRVHGGGIDFFGVGQHAFLVLQPFIFAGLENYLSQLGSWVLVAEGAIFVVCVLAFRRGIFGELSRILKRPL